MQVITTPKVSKPIHKLKNFKMKVRLLLATLLTVVIILPTNGQKNKEKNKEKNKDASAIKLANRMDTISYCLGVLYGGNLVKYGFNQVDSKLLSVGAEQMLTKQTPLIDEAKANEIVGKYAVEQQKLKGEKNLAEGKAYLEKNKKEAGVVVLPSGLQYKILKEGTGPKPGATDKVTVNYHGTLIDGTVFDSSVDRKEPLQLTVNGVIEGWKEALQLMATGSKWRLVIPSELAYGENPQQGGPIQPNSVLIFEVELISIDKDDATQQQPKIEMQPQQ
jgi:FKBP-type peptidyl-prolyl cis-trans isomerase FklB